MPFIKGQKKPTTVGDFKPGHDPRRTLTSPGRPPNPDERIIEIQAHMRNQLAETMYKLWQLGYKEVEKLVDDGNMSTGEMIAARFLHVTAKSGSYPHFQTILKTIGLNPPENLNVNVTTTLESIIVGAHKRLQEQRDGQQKQQLENDVQQDSVRASGDSSQSEVQRRLRRSDRDEEVGE